MTTMEEKFRTRGPLFNPMINDEPIVGHQYRRNVKRGWTSRSLNKFNKGKKAI